MDKFYNSFTFMLAFMILTLFINMLFGSKVTDKFLIVILISMVLFNIDSFTQFISNLSYKEA